MVKTIEITQKSSDWPLKKLASIFTLINSPIKINTNAIKIAIIRYRHSGDI